jgi:hypothetical protein
MYETKDLTRLQDIDRKGNSLDQKESLANHMASLITDREKCYRRYEASLEVFGPDHRVTGVFLRRWHILNGKGLMEKVPVVPKEKEVKVIVENTPAEDKEVIWGSTLPLVGESDLNDLKTRKGKSKGVLEIWETWTMQIVHIVRESDKPLVQIAAIANIENENGEFLFGGKMVDWVPTECKEAAIQRYGKPALERVYIA